MINFYFEKYNKIKVIPTSKNKLFFVGKINDVISKLNDITLKYNNICTASEYIACENHNEKSILLLKNSQKGGK